MFKSFHFRNYRTHRDTEIKLGRTTLLLGPNSSGKTNLLHALKDFANLGRIARPYDESADRTITGLNFANRTRHIGAREPILFKCDWEGDTSNHVSYAVELRQHRANAYPTCQEELEVKLRKGDRHSFKSESESTGLTLGETVWKEHSEVRPAIEAFFRELGSMYYFHFQPSMMRQEATRTVAQVKPRASRRRGYPRHDIRDFNMPRELGQAGEGLHHVLRAVKSDVQWDKFFSRFRVSMEQFSPDFRDYKLIEHQYKGKWQFKNPSPDKRLFDEYGDGQLADGFLRACAISLLTSMSKPPSSILIEELENGMDVVRLGMLIDWLESASSRTGPRNNSQFVITTHSPIVLQRFGTHLEDVYQIRRDPLTGHSVVLNLGEILRLDILSGRVNGKVTAERVYVQPDDLVYLWINRAIGGDSPPRYKEPG